MATKLLCNFYLYLLILEVTRRCQSQSIDQLLQSSMETSYAGDLMQDGNTVLMELDMLFTHEDWAAIQEGMAAESENARNDRSAEGVKSRRRKKRKALKALNRRWTNGEVPYELESGTFTSREQSHLRAAISDWNRYTCLNIRPKTEGDDRYLFIKNGGGCSSYVGMPNVPMGQTVNLAPGCRVKGVIIHELGHAIGFHHEQTRPDRNDYVRIMTDNIIPGKRFNFQQYKTDYINHYDVPYDYKSMMHYGQYYFSANGQRTIETVDPAMQTEIGNRMGHSFKDIKLANLMYSCSANCEEKTCPEEGFLGKDCKCYCPGNPIKECGSGGGGSGGGGSGGGSGGGTGEGECTDNHEQCEWWASVGECEKNPDYMLRSCRKACHECGCFDSHDQCEWWASVGECEKNPAYMLQNCQKSCKQCGCADYNDECPMWAAQGECEKNPRYMLPNCMRSCKQCGCIDYHPNCTIWAEEGSCEEHPLWMLPNCKVSCKQCGGDTGSGGCKTSLKGQEYIGNISVTKSGKTCQNWDSQSPHTHTRNDLSTFSYPDDVDSVSDLENYCRNPDGEPEGPWCYTTDPDIRWEYCDVPFCIGECKTSTLGTDYTGNVSKTKHGRTCQRWDSQSPHSHTNNRIDLFPDEGDSVSDIGNACRNPDNTEGGPWCYTTDPDIRWAYCDIPLCSGETGCRDLHVNCGSWARHGECESNPNWMNTNCKVSCNVCNGGATNACRDANSQCITWASEGYCTSGEYVSYMTQNCPHSCNTCVDKGDKDES